MDEKPNCVECNKYEKYDEHSIFLWPSILEKKRLHVCTPSRVTNCETKMKKYLFPSWSSVYSNPQPYLPYVAKYDIINEKFKNPEDSICDECFMQYVYDNVVIIDHFSCFSEHLDVPTFEELKTTYNLDKEKYKKNENERKILCEQRRMTISENFSGQESLIKNVQK
jgi:hypothetical protein